MQGNDVAFACGLVVGAVAGLVAGIVLVLRDRTLDVQPLAEPPEVSGWEGSNVRPIGRMPGKNEGERR